MILIQFLNLHFETNNHTRDQEFVQLKRGGCEPGDLEGILKKKCATRESNPARPLGRRTSCHTNIEKQQIKIVGYSQPSSKIY